MKSNYNFKKLISIFFIIVFIVIFCIVISELFSENVNDENIHQTYEKAVEFGGMDNGDIYELVKDIELESGRMLLCYYNSDTQMVYISSIIKTRAGYSYKRISPYLEVKLVGDSDYISGAFKIDDESEDIYVVFGKVNTGKELFINNKRILTNDQGLFFELSDLEPPIIKVR